MVMHIGEISSSLYQVHIDFLPIGSCNLPIIACSGKSDRKLAARLTYFMLL